MEAEKMSNISKHYVKENENIENDIVLDKLNMDDKLEVTITSCTVHQPSDPISINAHHSASNELENQSHELNDLDKLSSSFCDSESLASVSQSIGDEDMEYKKDKKKKKKKKKNSNQVHGDKEIPRPNYFVGVQISNPEIHKAVIDVQKMLLSSNENVSSALIDVATLHITLLVAHIANEDELHVACSALDHCGAKLSGILSNPPIHLKFHGVSHFSNQTIFAKVVEDENYERFLSTAETVRSKFDEMGVTMPDKRAFAPHLTIAKLSKVPRGKGKDSIRKIEPSAYASELNKEFGEQTVTGIQLLSMNKPKNQKRYYPIIRESLFDFVPKESLDHAQCCFPRQPPTPKLKRRLHTSTTNTTTTITTSSSEVQPLVSSFSNAVRPYRPLALTVIGGIGLLSFAFALSRWMRRK